MSMSPSQCRAGRALLNWSQDQLAENAQVARATIADFETVGRMPMRNNMVSIRSALEAAGVAFIDEEGDSGAGVRFRKIELEYSKEVKVAPEGVVLRLVYRGKRYKALVPRRIIDDLHRADFHTDQERVKAVEQRLPVILVAIERVLKSGQVQGDAFEVSHECFDEAVW